MKYEVKMVNWNWDKKCEATYIATDFSFDNASTLRVIVEGKKRPMLFRDYCVESVTIIDLETEKEVLRFIGTDTKH